MSSDPLAIIGQTAINAVVAPIQQRINSEIDQIAFQARARLAKTRGLQPEEVTDLEVAEYMLSMPLSETNRQIVLAGNSVRNGVIAGCALIAFAMIVNGMRKPQ
jgi:hypothetical protein